MIKRCDWVPEDNQLYKKYHDTEWGVPLHDDRLLFEAIILDGVQAGLSWLTVLKKREHYRKVYDNFDVIKVSQYNSEKIDDLLNDKGIIRGNGNIAAFSRNISSVFAFRPGTFLKIYGINGYIPTKARKLS